MGQQCSCLQHPRKYQRRPSDTNASASDEDESEQELHILIDGHRGGSEMDELLAEGGDVKRGGKAAAILDDDELKRGEEGELLDEERLMLDSLGHGLMGGAEQAHDSQQVLRSYQAVTGMVARAVDV